MLLEGDGFMAALAALYAATEKSGSVTVTLKRYDFEGVKEERQRKRARREAGDEALERLAGRMTLSDKEYPTLVRAATESKKISTLVAPAELSGFLARYHGLLLTSVHNITRDERLRRKKLAVKRQAKAKKLKQRQQQQQQKAAADAP
ncbi:hypothetical protein IWQ56_004900 [Coemansia nantahalensis]|nr:hypothetical protein IWQ56_004900 [Coemansia nantahalensis]